MPPANLWFHARLHTRLHTRFHARHETGYGPGYETTRSGVDGAFGQGPDSGRRALAEGSLDAAL
eukprot:16430517-Heterocapsa_arctica.AAC.1